jgi:hypothetical protein
MARVLAQRRSTQPGMVVVVVVVAEREWAGLPSVPSMRVGIAPHLAKEADG